MMGPVEHDIGAFEKVEGAKPWTTPSSLIQSLSETAIKEAQLNREAYYLRQSQSKTQTASELLLPQQLISFPK